MVHYSGDEIRRLSDYLRPDSPLGPRDGGRIADDFVARTLFETDNEIYKSIRRRPSIVIGRRGSGKTSFLKHLETKEYIGHVVVNVSLSDALVNIETFLRSSPTDALPGAESVARLWDWLFWTALLLKVRDERSVSLEAILRDLPLPERFSAFVSRTRFTTLANLASHFTSASSGGSEIAAFATGIIMSGQGFSADRLETLKRIVKSTLKKSQSKAIILIDSMEQFELDDRVKNRVTEGLLMSAGRFNAVLGRPEVRLCLPSELYSYFEGVSTNIAKDFENDIKLHWHPRELLNVVAGRYLTYLACNEDQVNPDDLAYLRRLRGEAGARNWGVRFWEYILPKAIKNRYGVTEPTITYIIRHTHLLPRQLIIYLNAILSKNIAEGHSLTKVDPIVLVESLMQAEPDGWKEVCNAYRALYPDATQICKAAVMHLPLTFRRGDLDRVFPKHIQPLLGRFQDPSLDSYGFARMLVEIGCVGVVRETEETGTYIKADFEYNNSNEVNAHSNALMCLHPMFCSIRQRPAEDLSVKVIMPFGNEPDARDTRQFR